MVRHYFTTILRTLNKSKIYSLLNITGLTIGMVVFFLIMLYVKYEFSVDQYHENKDRIYRIVKHEAGNMYLGNDRFAVTMAPLGPTVENEFPEVELATRIVRGWNVLIKVGNKVTEEPIVHGIDPQAFRIFTFEYLYGNPGNFLADKYSAVVSESTAKKYFPDENPIGKSFLYKEQYEFIIGGVIKDMPDNSHFRMEIMLPFETYLELNNSKDRLTYWNSSSYYTYVLLQKDSKPESLEAKFPAMWKMYNKDDSGHGDNTKFYLQQFSKIHLHSNIHFDIAPTVNVNLLYVYASIAFLILLIACINYMNLATARASLRAKEVGIRKVSGASRINLILQFLGESFLLTFISIVLSIIVIALILPYYEQFIELNLSMNLLQHPELLILLLLVAGFVGIVSGSYPSFMLSAFKPITVLKGKFTKSEKGSNLRNALVIAQFSISGCLIIITLIIIRQLNFIQNKEMGFDREHIITLTLKDPDILNKIMVFKQELIEVQGVTNVASSSNFPNNISSSTEVNWPGKPDEINWSIYSGKIDYNFVDLYDIEIVKGRNFSEEAGDQNAILINETAAKALGWDEIIGKELQNWSGDTLSIVGIMKDFHQHSLHQKIMPLQLWLGDNVRHVSVRIAPDNIDETIKGIKQAKDKISDKYPFSYAFLDDQFDKAYKTEQKTAKLATWVTAITILIACLGLYGLASFTADQRLKEVGIRKILGAKMLQLLYLLSKDFTTPVVLSFLISVPVAYISMQKWLEGFAYHIELSVLTFLATFVIMILIAWLTVSYRTLKVANSNPVNSLRDE